MIGIPDYSGDFVREYGLEMGDKVYEKVKKTPSVWVNYFSTLSSNTLPGKQFFVDVLTLTPEESCNKYPSVRDYFDYAFFASLSLDRIHAGEKDRKVRSQTRIKYFKQYILGNRLFGKLHGSIMPDAVASSDKQFKHLQSVMRATLEKKINKKIVKSIDYGQDIQKRHRVAILDDLAIKTCPYCNRQYVAKLDIDIGKPLGDIDHFYPKSYFPLFGLSLYNFVPSCKICNSLFKSDVNADIQYPYRMARDSNLEFQISNDAGELTPGNLYGWNDDFELDVINDPRNPLDEQQTKREIDFFELKAQYGIHKDYARELLYKKNVVNGMNLSMIRSCFQNQGFNVTDSEIKEILYGFDVDHIDLTQKPLAKLTKDLYEKY